MLHSILNFRLRDTENLDVNQEIDSVELELEDIDGELEEAGMDEDIVTDMDDEEDPMAILDEYFPEDEDLADLGLDEDEDEE